jgi:hypothetical protein
MKPSTPRLLQFSLLSSVLAVVLANLVPNNKALLFCSFQSILVLTADSMHIVKSYV